jgi:CheY-like chemotaxis protein
VQPEIIAGYGNEAIKQNFPWILVIEDHEEVSHYIAESIRMDYKVVEVPDSTRGYSIAEEIIPDLIICDIMMPGMDGFELCRLLKHNTKTSHIPVIMITARAGEADRINGLQTGADDYLVKPFNVRELRIRIKNLIENRRILREKFTSNSIIRPDEISVTSRDAAFIEKLLRVVEKNIGNYSFSVEDLCREAGMSQSQMHRKLKATVNMPANHFIRSVRMRRAMELLKQGAGNISDISYMVGYDDPGYFTKSFHKFFGKMPSEVPRGTG